MPSIGLDNFCAPPNFQCARARARSRQLPLLRCTHPSRHGPLMKTVRLTVLLVCGLIAVLAADILLWYRVARRPPPYTRKIPRLEWTRAIDPLYLTFTPPLIGKDGTLYVASAGGVHALNASSVERWVYRASESDPILSGSLSQDDAGNLYFATLHSVYSLSSSGLKRWQADCPRAALARNAGGHAFDADAIYTTCDTHLVALSKFDGHETWRLRELEVQAPGPFLSHPCCCAITNSSSAGTSTSSPATCAATSGGRSLPGRRARPTFSAPAPMTSSTRGNSRANCWPCISLEPSSGSWMA